MKPLKPKGKPGRKKKVIPGVTDVQKKREVGVVSRANENIAPPEDVVPIQRDKPRKKSGRPKKDSLPMKESPPKNLYDIDVSKVQHMWERLPHENDIAFLGFKTYMDLGPNRTIRDAAILLTSEPKTEEKIQAVVRNLYSYSTDNKWDERLIARDRFLQRVEDQETITRIKARVKRNQNLFDDAKDLLEKEIKALKLKRDKAPEDKPILSATQMTNLMDVVVSREIDNDKAAAPKDDEASGNGRKVVHQIIMVGTGQAREPIDVTPTLPPDVIDVKAEVIKDAEPR
jgi:hypothetical protein